MPTSEEQIKELINKAATAEKSEDAMKFSQAALNAAHAEQVTKQTQLSSK